jgi:hypothetical protein
MDAQALVLDLYPDAEAIEEPPIFRHGDFSPVDAGYWAILADSGALPLGDGATEDQAWQDAARKLTAAEPPLRQTARQVGGRRPHSRWARLLYLLG